RNPSPWSRQGAPRRWWRRSPAGSGVKGSRPMAERAGGVDRVQSPSAQQEPRARMKFLIRRPPVALLVFALGVLGLWPGSRADERDRLAVGLQPDGRVVVPTNQVLKPAGRQILFPGRPVDLALTDDGQTLVVKNIKDLVFIDTAAGKVKQTL